MPLARNAQHQREADTVRSQPNRAGFWCPNTDALDAHLARLSEQRKAPTLTDAGRRRFAEDIDALLLRRFQFMTFKDGLTSENTL